MKIFQIESSDIVPQKGRILISSPFIMDYNFNRTVVLIVQHNEEGSMGLVINKGFVFNIALGDVLPNIDLNVKVPIYKGGPMERDSLFYIHKLGFINGAIPLGDDVYINGDFNEILDFIAADDSKSDSIKFFCGYAGWQVGQLEKEIRDNMWIVSSCSQEYIFNNGLKDIWNLSLNTLGGKYSIWSKYPQFPMLN